MNELMIDESGAGVVTLTMNRPERMNALNVSLIEALKDALRSTGARKEVRAIVLTGSGRAFCAGADMKASGSESLFAGQDAHSLFQAAENLADLVSIICATKQPVIAAINGPAVGGGFAIALCSDIRIASRASSFNVQFPKLGLSGCEMGMSYLLPRIVGAGRAFDMMLTSRTIDAAEAERIGLVSAVVDPEALLTSAAATAAQIAGSGQFGVEQTKQVMWSNLVAPSLDAALALECRTQIMITTSLRTNLQAPPTVV